MQSSPSDHRHRYGRSCPTSTTSSTLLYQRPRVRRGNWREVSRAPSFWEGRRFHQAARDTSSTQVEKRVFHKESVKSEPQTPNLLITYFGKGPTHNPEIPSHIVQHTADRGPRQPYPAHLENTAVARPGSSMIEAERPQTQPCSPAATIVPVAPNMSSTQMKTVDKPVAPSLPGTSAYKQQILKEQKLGPLPADDPRLQPILSLMKVATRISCPLPRRRRELSTDLWT